MRKFYAKVILDVCFASEEPGDYKKYMRQEFEENSNIYLSRNVEITEVNSVEDVSDGWKVGSIIYGTKGKDFTVKSFLKSKNEDLAKEKLFEFIFNNGNEEKKKEIFNKLLREVDDLSGFVKALEDIKK